MATAVGDIETTAEDTAVIIAVLDNDTVEVGTLPTIFADPTYGVVALLGDGTIEYTPNEDFFGVDTFTYEVSDINGTTTAEVSVTVEAVNDAPVEKRNEGLTIGRSETLVIDNQALRYSDVDSTAKETVYTLTAISGLGHLSLDGVELGVGDTFTQRDINLGLLAYTSINGAPKNDEPTFEFSVGNPDPDNEGSYIDTVSGSFDIFIEAGVDDQDLKGTGGDDNLIGGIGDDRLYGRNGSDQLVGNDGDDLLIGGGGDDLLVGGNGDDFLLGGGGDDQLVGDDGNDTLKGGAGDDEISGLNGDDTIYGQAGDDRLYGHSGDDTIIGGGGSDFITGNEGDDTLNGGSGNDDVYGGSGADFIKGARGNDRLYGDQGDDEILGNSGADYLYGGDGNDTLAGGGGDDFLYGDLGNDVLDGGGGDDLLNGGLGTDIFVLSKGTDTAEDFTIADDKVAILDAGVSSLAEAIDAGIVRNIDDSQPWLGVEIVDGNKSLILSWIQLDSLTESNFAFSTDDYFI